MSPPKTKTHVVGTYFVGYLRTDMCGKKKMQNAIETDAEKTQKPLHMPEQSLGV